MKYKVTADWIEYLNDAFIEAENEEEAKEKYEDLWNSGNVLFSSGDLSNWKVEKLKEETDEDGKIIVTSK